MFRRDDVKLTFVCTFFASLIVIWCSPNTYYLYKNTYHFYKTLMTSLKTPITSLKTLITITARFIIFMTKYCVLYYIDNFINFIRRYCCCWRFINSPEHVQNIRERNCEGNWRYCHLQSDVKWCLPMCQFCTVGLLYRKQNYLNEIKVTQSDRWINFHFMKERKWSSIFPMYRVSD